MLTQTPLPESIQNPAKTTGNYTEPRPFCQEFFSERHVLFNTHLKAVVK